MLLDDAENIGVAHDDLAVVLAIIAIIATKDRDVAAEVIGGACIVGAVHGDGGRILGVGGANAVQLFVGFVTIVPNLGQVGDGSEGKFLFLGANAIVVIGVVGAFDNLFDDGNQFSLLYIILMYLSMGFPK